MNINEFNEKIISNNASGVYYIDGKDVYFSENMLDKIKIKLKGLDFLDLNVTIIKENFDYSEFVASLNTLPFASKYRLIIVYTVSFDLNSFEFLKKNFPEIPDFAVIIFVDNYSLYSTNKNSGMNFGSYFSQFNCINNSMCSSVFDELILYAAKYNIKMNRTAAEFLYDYSTNDTNALMKEMNKLVNVCSKEITKDDITKYCIRRDEYKAFMLHTYMMEERYELAESLFEELNFSNSTMPVWIINMIYKNFSKMLAAKLCMEAKYNFNKIFEILKDKYDIKTTGHAKSVCYAAKNFSSEAIRNSMIKLGEIEYACKHGEYNLYPDFFSSLICIYRNKKESQ